MIRTRRNRPPSLRRNAHLARSLWGVLSVSVLEQLKELTRKHRLSIAAGHLQLLEGRWYVTHAGLLHIAELRRCTGIRTSVERHLSDCNSNHWVFKAVAYKRFYGLRRCRSIQHVSACSRRGNAYRRNTGSKPGPPKGLWHRSLLRRGVGIASILRRASEDNSGRSGERQWLLKWPASTARQALPTDSKLRTRSHPGKTVRSRLLWHGDSSRCQQRFS